ncbi:hypothetical protein [Rheinheimera sp.]|uniref:hypothetical protein n=1 Tax=Rheinheimera sp. TaxID=1869214 RepID=UPI00307F47FD
MKPVQIIGLLFSLLAFGYYASFSDGLTTDSSPTGGFGVMLVFLLQIISACLLIPSSFWLWRKKTREFTGFNTPFWLTLLGVNSLLSLLYTGYLLMLLGTLAWFLIQIK